MQRELLACDTQEPLETWSKEWTLSGSFMVVASLKRKAKQTPRYVYYECFMRY